MLLSINKNYVNEYDEILFGGIGAIEYYKSKNKILVSDYSLNVTNYETVAILSSKGVNRITLSNEICKDDINNLAEEYYTGLSKEDLAYMQVSKDEVLDLYRKYYRADKTVSLKD